MELILVRLLPVILALALSFPAAHAQEKMLVLKQVQRGLGPMTTYIYRNGAKAVLTKQGWVFQCVGPDYQVVIYNPKTRLMSKKSFASFERDGPETAGYIESEIPSWPLVVEKDIVKYAGRNALQYALPLLRKNGQVVSLKYGKAGEYVMEKDFQVDLHVAHFLQALQRTPPEDKIPLRFAKFGFPNRYGHGLRYNKAEEWVINLTTDASALMPCDRKLFGEPRGFKLASEGEVTLGSKAADMNQIFEDLDAKPLIK